MDRPPADVVRNNVRPSLQPLDAPPTAENLDRLLDHMQPDKLLLFSTDYPHWQFYGGVALPDGLSTDLVWRIMIDYPFATYARLLEPAR